MLNRDDIKELYPYDRPLIAGETQLEWAKDLAAGMYLQSIDKQMFGKLSPMEYGGLRCSGISKPMFDLLGKKFFPHHYQWLTDNRMMQVFHDGDVFEGDYLCWLVSRGVQLLLSQIDLRWYDVPGHADYVVELSSGTRVLLELKTCNTEYFKSLQKQYNPDQVYSRYGEYLPYVLTDMTNHRGHVTQTALYMDYLYTNDECDEAVIVVKDKSSSQILLYNLPFHSNSIEDLLEKTKRKAHAYVSCETWVDAYSIAGIPTPIKELSGRKHTGRYLTPPSLYSCPVFPLLYEWSPGEKDKVIITGYRIPEEVTELPEGLEDSYNEIGLYEYPLSQAEDMIIHWKNFLKEKQR